MIRMIIVIDFVRTKATKCGKRFQKYLKYNCIDPIEPILQIEFFSNINYFAEVERFFYWNSWNRNNFKCIYWAWLISFWIISLFPSSNNAMPHTVTVTEKNFNFEWKVFLIFHLKTHFLVQNDETSRIIQILYRSTNQIDVNYLRIWKCVKMLGFWRFNNFGKFKSSWNK